MKPYYQGRVNSRKRIRYARSIGCDSIDGSSFAVFRDTWLQAGLDWTAEAAADRPGRQLRIG